MRKPMPLAAGAAVRVIAPCSPFNEEKLRAGVEILASFGLDVVVPARVHARDGYLAGRDADRATELADAMTSPECAGVLAARGGFGATRILGSLSARVGSFVPRPFMGFSDVTALHALLAGEGGMVTIHGPNVASLASVNAGSLSRTRAALFGEDRERTFSWTGLRPVCGGRATGRLFAGNLSMMCALAGTRWAPPMVGTVLVIEDTGEPPYRLDRMFTHLSMLPGVSDLAAVVLGDLGRAGADTAGVMAIGEAFARGLGKPAVAGFPIGHGAVNHPVPEGVMAEVDADTGAVRVVEDPYG